MDRQQRMVELFEAASELQPEEQSAFLGLKCADDTKLLAEIKSLLDWDGQAEADQFMDVPAIDLHARQIAAEYAEQERVGQLYSHYRILSLIGVGGMAEVYLAEDTKLERKVALKLIKGNLTTKEILRRFHNEQHILANLQHPNIARLLDGDKTDDGLPFFVMDYIEGQPIDAYVEAHKLSMTEKLKLFRKVCSAVQYAHQNLIIHRDIKPSNIIVTTSGEPKLLDFGIAKLFQASDSQKPDVTATMLPVMTLAYASPEQVEEGQPITTATDVYSLGVLLYELLTGCRPYKLKSGSKKELEKAIFDQAPEKPSDAILRAEGPMDAAHRTASQPAIKMREGELGRLRRRLRGDLDNIVLRALSKEPQRRYASVEQFSEDIRRYLEGLPIIAGKDTIKYRTAKFVQRNKVAVAATAIILATLIGAVIATAWEAHVALSERARAERRFNDVRKLANSFMFELNDEIEKGPTKAREILVKKALEYLNKLAQEDGNDTSLQRELATAYLKVGDVQGKPLRANLGDTKGALESYRKSLAIYENLARGNSSDQEVQRGLLIAYSSIGYILARERIDMDGAQENLSKAIAINEKLLVNDPANSEYRRLLRESYFRYADMIGWSTGKYPPDRWREIRRLELDYLRKALALSESFLAVNPNDESLRSDVATTYWRIAVVLPLTSSEESKDKDLRLAEEAQEKSLEMVSQLVTAYPIVVRYRRNLADEYILKGLVSLEKNDPASALKAYHKALPIFKSLLATDPSNADARHDLAQTQQRTAGVLVRMNNTIEALENYRAAAQLYEKMIEADPAHQDNLRELMFVYWSIGDLLGKKGNMAGALDSYHKSLTLYESLIPDAPTDNELRRASAGINFQIGKLYARRALVTATSVVERVGIWRKARSLYQKSLDIWQDMSNKGILSGEDVGKPDEVAREIAKCDAALEKFKANY